jgi:hypothetical protein
MTTLTPGSASRQATLYVKTNSLRMGFPKDPKFILNNKRRYDQAVRVETQFQELDLRDEDKQRGVPKVRISEANRITNIPGED